MRLFAVKTLAFKSNLPRPSAKAQDLMATPGTSNGVTGSPGAGAPSSSDLFPDALTASFDCAGEQLSVVYSDRSLIIWDIRNLNKVHTMTVIALQLYVLHPVHILCCATLCLPQMLGVDPHLITSTTALLGTTGECCFMYNDQLCCHSSAIHHVLM